MIITHDLAIGGLQRVVVSICKTIDRNRFNVSVLCLNELGEFAPDIEEMGINVHLLQKKKSKVDYLSFLKVAKILINNEIEIIHTHNTQPLIDGTLGAMLSKVKTIVHTDHARDFPDKRRYMFLEWLLSHYIYKVVGVSDHTVENLIKYEKISKEKTVSIMNGIDESLYEIDVKKEEMKKELGIKKCGPVIGLGVRLTKQKGIIYLLQAMKIILQKIPNISLIIAGSGPLENDLKKATLDMCIQESVYFIGPRLDMNRVLKYLDLYVLPSLWEGLPMVLLEAMAAGCPIVATNVGGNSMAIKHGHNGSLIEAKNVELLASEVIKMLQNEDLRHKYVRNSHEIFRECFSARIMTEKYEKLYLREPLLCNV